MLNHFRTLVQHSSLRRQHVSKWTPFSRSTPRAMKLSTDSNPVTKAAAIMSVGVYTNESLLRIQWENGSKNRYPLVYLRDSCPCPLCFHPSIQQRVSSDYDIYQQDYTQLGDVTVSECGTKLRITWPDKHFSTYDYQWLHTLKLPESNVSTNEDVVPRGMITWDSHMTGHFPRVDFQSVLDQDRCLFDWLKHLQCRGVCVVGKAPQNLGAVNKLGARVGHLRITMDGPTYSVQKRPDSDSLGFTDAGLPLHSDYPYCEQTPGVQMFHCITQAQGGGETILLDGFNVAKQLKSCDPDSFQLLTETNVPFWSMGNTVFGEYFFRCSKPLIQLDSTGFLTYFVFNNINRELAPLSMPVELVQRFYQAFGRLTNLIQDKENQARFKMNPGDVLTVNNARVLHGRGEITDEGDVSRILDVAYMDWDVVLSKLRILSKKFGFKDAN